MRRKLIVAVCMVTAILIAAGTLFLINSIKTQNFILQLEQNNAIDEKEKSEILEIYTNHHISSDDKEELSQLIEKYPELFYDKGGFQEECDNFDEIKMDCEIVVQSIKEYIENEHCEQPLCITVNEKGNKTILCGLDDEYNDVEVDISVYESMRRIENSFLERGYSFSIIRIAEDTICFNTEDGRYSLMYTLDEKTPQDKGLDKVRNRQYVITHINGSWYHSIFDKYI